MLVSSMNASVFGALTELPQLHLIATLVALICLAVHLMTDPRKPLGIGAGLAFAVVGGYVLVELVPVIGVLPLAQVIVTVALALGLAFVRIRRAG
jgi:hypothetical protein